MLIIYNKNYFLIKYNNKVLWKQYCINKNKSLTYLYIIYTLSKFGLINLRN